MPDTQNKTGSVINEPIACVIPAYNEEQHIGAVLDVLCNTSELSEIIVVDDCSTDTTQNVVKSYLQGDPRVRMLCTPQNSGKGGAMVLGANAAKSDLLLFLDADLVRLKREHILSLVEPITMDSTSMTIGLFTQGRFQTDWAHKLTPYLSGQRCLRWSLFKDAPDIDGARYGVEVALNLHAWHHRYKIRYISWPGVTHMMKPEKYGGLRGANSYLTMYLEIAKYVVRHMGRSS
jgi:glycosyltransferase involved in cell wall biosynthesis